MGNIYGYKKEYLKTLDYYTKALKIRLKTKDVKGLADSYTNIGEDFEKIYSAKKTNWDTLQTQFHLKKGDLLDSALMLYHKSLVISKNFGDQYGMIYVYEGIGNIMRDKKQWRPAWENFKKATYISKKLDAKAEAMDAFIGLSSCEEKLNMPDSALEHYKLYVAMKDSIFSKDKSMEIGKMEAGFNYQKRMLEQKRKEEKKDIINKEEHARQNTIIYSTSFVLLLLAMFVFLLYNRFKITKKQKDVIEEQKQEVDNAYMALNTKNKEITDSIHYAQRIQTALLKPEESVSSHFPEHFILYMPKDIVAGDFYWGFEKTFSDTDDSLLYIAVGDCTGHGVPGGFLSMLGIAFLNEIVSVEEILTPAEILNRLNKKFIKELNQENNEDFIRDGMDISLISVRLGDKKTDKRVIQYAGANNPLWRIKPVDVNTSDATSAFEIIETKADKQPIGMYIKELMHPFTNHIMEVEAGTSIYIFSDGYADQFGGVKGKKFKYKRLKDLLLSNQDIEMPEQKNLLIETFNNWKGDNEQVDDVCMIGIKI